MSIPKLTQEKKELCTYIVSLKAKIDRISDIMDKSMKTKSKFKIGAGLFESKQLLDSISLDIMSKKIKGDLD